MALVSARQDLASINSQAQLIEVLDYKYLNRKEFKLELTNEVRLLAKSFMKKLNQMNAPIHLPKVVPKFLYYQIGQKGYYEMLAIEFVKHLDKIPLKNKARLLYWFALADIDSSYILKTCHKLCASFTEAFHLRSHGELPQLGLFTEQQVRYITEAQSELEAISKNAPTP